VRIFFTSLMAFFLSGFAGGIVAQICRGSAPT
jgi:hypothetical protein